MGTSRRNAFIMKTVKDLRIGDPIYLVTKEDIFKKTVTALKYKSSVETEVEIKMFSFHSETVEVSPHNTAVPIRNYYQLYLNLEEAQREQLRMRMEYLEKIKEGIKGLVEKKEAAIQLFNSPLSSPKNSSE